MKRSYEAELAELPSTYAAVLAADARDQVAAAVCSQRPMMYVGSGGALAVARLAADLHMSQTGELAVAVTPLEAASSAMVPTVGVVLFSARGRNPDATFTIAAARTRGAQHMAVVTTRSRSELPPALGAPDVQVASIPSPPDGFLATNSLLAMATAVCLAHGFDLPQELPSFGVPSVGCLGNACLVLTAPGLAAVGLDIEARMVETGLARVQLADYRNLAHGRHVGLMRQVDDTTVIAASSPETTRIAEHTLALLPKEVTILPLASSLDWPGSVLDLLVASMALTGSTGREHGVDPGRPGVAPFGRKLYHLRTSRLVDVPAPDPIRRKLAFNGLETSYRLAYEQDLKKWLADIPCTPISGVVLDYDGTCCSTLDRYEPPIESVRAQVLRLLDDGLVVGFATGRGKSLHADTRAWLPERAWPRVHVGLYNGTLLLRLSDDPPDCTVCDGLLAEAADRLEGVSDIHQLVVLRRTSQVSVSTASGCLAGEQLLPLVLSVLARSPVLDCSVVASGHSVDILTAKGGKVSVVDTVRAEAGGEVLAIGDQGQVGGNDFELLASSTTTLSVDRCSADPTRCWNLDRRGDRGPDLLVRYLSSIKYGRFRWRE
jgi:hypothetical protein